MVKEKVFTVDVGETTVTGIWKRLEQSEKAVRCTGAAERSRPWVRSESKKEEECERVKRKESPERERKDKRSQES